MTRWVHRLFLFFLLPGLAACSAYAPEILGVETTELRVYSREAAARQELLLDLEVEDRDGFAELDRIYVIHDQGELYWELSSQEWEAHPEEGRIRLLRLAAAELPRGEYRLELFDLGGRSGEGSFTLSLLPEAAAMEAMEVELLALADELEGQESGADPGGVTPRQERESGAGRPAAGRAAGESSPPESRGDLGVIVLVDRGEEARFILPPGALTDLEGEALIEAVREATERFSGSSGRYALYGRVGEAGPIFLYELQEDLDAF